MSFNPLRYSTPEEVYAAAARTILKVIVQRKGDARWLTGCSSTINPTNRLIVEGLLKSSADLTKLWIANQDEWGTRCKGALHGNDGRLFKSTVRQVIYSKLSPRGFDPLRQTFWPQDLYPPSRIFSPGTELPEVDAALSRGRGIDVAMLVPGEGGHMAFWEAMTRNVDTWLSAFSTCVSILPQTRRNNKNYRGCGGQVDRVPKTALTIGPGTLLRCMKPGSTLVIAARGAHNATNVQGILEGDVGPQFPINVWRLLVEKGVNVEFYFDDAAGALIK